MKRRVSMQSPGFGGFLAPKARLYERRKISAGLRIVLRQIAHFCYKMRGMHKEEAMGNCILGKDHVKTKHSPDRLSCVEITYDMHKIPLRLPHAKVLVAGPQLGGDEPSRLLISGE